MEEKKYIIITPARNEEDFIKFTIESVISQSVLPLKWVIVSDGSTDGTDDIVSTYSKKHKFIYLLSANSTGDRNFGSKVNAIKAGFKLIDNENYDYLGFLDADVSFDSNYFKAILEKFEGSQKLGVGGGIIQELIKGKYVTQNNSLNSVAGAVQTFRRKCYEDIGGYIPLKYGGIDTAAEIIARSKGWDVQTFPELKVLHHRRVMTGKGNQFKVKYRHGITHYMLGYHPLFQILRCLLRIKDRPYFLGSFFIMLGYLNATRKKYERQLPDDVVAFLQKEQMQRIKKLSLLR